ETKHAKDQALSSHAPVPSETRRSDTPDNSSTPSRGTPVHKNGSAAVVGTGVLSTPPTQPAKTSEESTPMAAGLNPARPARRITGGSSLATAAVLSVVVCLADVGLPFRDEHSGIA